MHVMKSRNSSSKPLYERPGRLSSGRNVPAAPKAPNEDLRLKVHYDGEEEIPDPVKGTTAEFTSGSLNALNPFEDEALLSGEVKPRNTGRLTGAEPIQSQIFEAEADFDEEWLDEFSTFSIYQMLPKIIELWCLNVQTDVESKKNSRNRSADDHTLVSGSPRTARHLHPRP